MGQLKAGAARVNITPYVGINQSGFGSRKKGSVGIHDDLYAKAVVLDDGSTKIGIVGCDLLNLDESSVASIRKRVRELTGMDGENVFISTSHTHSGPLWTYYKDVLVKPIGEAVALAIDDLEPCKIGMATGKVEGVSQNRRLIIDGDAL